MKQRKRGVSVRQNQADGGGPNGTAIGMGAPILMEMGKVNYE